MASKTQTESLTVRSRKRSDALDITDRVEQLVRESDVSDGLCHVYVPHTTAGVFINENADPDVLTDLLGTLDNLVPWEGGYRHAEGNAAAHIKSTLVGTSQTSRYAKAGFSSVAGKGFSWRISTARASGPCG